MAQFTTGYDSPPSKPSLGNLTMRKIGKGIANYFGREHTTKNVNNFQKTLVKYIHENSSRETDELAKWARIHDNVPMDWKKLIYITQVEIEMHPPKKQYLRYRYDIIQQRISWMKWCIRSGYNIMAKYLINEFYSDYSHFSDGYLDDKFLLIALENDNKEIITELLNNGADPNIKDETTGKTPLMMAIEKRNVELAKELLRYKKVSNPEESYILLIAMENDNKELITDLLNNGADPNIKDETTGKTPLMMAIEKRNVELAKELLRHKADTSNIKDNNGRTAIDIAKGTEHKEIIRLLRPFSTAVNELRQDMRSNGVSRTKDNNKYLNVVANSDLSRQVRGYLGEGGKRKKKNKEKQNKSHKRRKTRKSKTRKSKKNRTKKYKH